MRDILLIAVIVLCALWAVRQPAFGMLAFVFFSVFNAQSYAWSIGATFPFAQVIALGTLAGFLFWNESKRLPIKRETLLILALWVMFVISSAFADYTHYAWAKATYVSKVFIMVLLSTILINNHERLRNLIRVIAFALGFYAVKGCIFFFTSGGSQRVWGPEGSYLESNNAIGLAMAMNIPILYCLSRMETRRSVVWLLRIMLVTSYFSILGTFSRGAWLGAAASSAVLIWKSNYRILVVATLLIIAVVLVPLAPERVVERFEQLENPEDDSAQSRLWTWRFAYRVALANPLTGAGFDYYGVAAYEKYWPQMRERWPRSRGWTCHSIWFTILSEHGFVALFLWLCLLGSTFLSSRKLESASRSQPELQWAGGYAVMIQGGVAAYVVAGTFLDAAYFEVFYQLLAVVIIIKQLVTAQAGKREPPDSLPTSRVAPGELNSGALGSTGTTG